MDGNKYDRSQLQCLKDSLSNANRNFVKWGQGRKHSQKPKDVITPDDMHAVMQSERAKEASF